jgi:hypothetical protein
MEGEGKSQKRARFMRIMGERFRWWFETARDDRAAALRGKWLRLILAAALACCLLVPGLAELAAAKGSGGGGGGSGGGGSHSHEGDSHKGGFEGRRCASSDCRRAGPGGSKPRRQAQRPPRKHAQSAPRHKKVAEQHHRPRAERHHRQVAERHQRQRAEGRPRRAPERRIAEPRPAPVPAPPLPPAVAPRLPDTHPRFVIPAAKEKRYVPREVLVEIPPSLSAEALQSLERRLGLTRIVSRNLSLVGSRVHRYSIARSRTLEGVVRKLRDEGLVAGAQPNYLYSLQQDPRPQASSEAASPQYIVAALHLAEAHRLATGKGVRIAIIDSGIDGESFGIKDRIVARLDTVGDSFAPDRHGTAIAGAIVAHGQLTGVAPDAQLIAIRAFTGGREAGSTTATSERILQALEFAASQNANIVNMSFAGPDDAMLDRALDALRARGIAEIAAAGNGGAQSAPLFPGAEPGVIAVTATDQKGRLFGLANRGAYIALAAPGVDILLPAPAGSIQIVSGTSISAAHVTGIAALALERYGTLTPDALVKTLDAGAHMPDAAASSEEYGAGIVDAYEVVQPRAGAGLEPPVMTASAMSAPTSSLDRPLQAR